MDSINKPLLILPASKSAMSNDEGKTTFAWYQYMSNANKALYDLNDSLNTTNTTVATLTASTAASVSTLTTAVSHNTPPGVVFEYAAAAAPTGWLLCDGTAVSRSTYSGLFAIIGTAYGVGDGTTTFNVPDKRGRTGIGSGTGSGLTARTLGDTSVGEETHKLITGELPAHTHGPSNGQTNYIGFGGALSIVANGTGSVIAGPMSTTGSTGSDTAHNNMQPSIVMNYIIKT